MVWLSPGDNAMPPAHIVFFSTMKTTANFGKVEYRKAVQSASELWGEIISVG